MDDDWKPDADEIAALIEEIGVDPIEGDRDWNAEIWIPEYAEPILGEVRFAALEAQLAELPGIERLAWEDRERFLVRLSPGTEPGAFRSSVVEVVRGAVRDAGHELP